VAAVFGIPYLRDVNAWNDYISKCPKAEKSLGCEAVVRPDEPDKGRANVADVSGAVGGAALAVGIGLVIYHYASGPDEAAKENTDATTSRPFFGVAPTKGGAFGTVGVRF
jgi:hypothetical protein